MSLTTVLVRLRARLVQKCVFRSSSSTHPSSRPLLPELLHTKLLHNRSLYSRSLYYRSLHTTPTALKVSGSQRQQFTEELQKQLNKDDLQGSGRGRLDFDKVPMEQQDRSTGRRSNKSRDVLGRAESQSRFSSSQSDIEIEPENTQGEIQGEFSSSQGEIQTEFVENSAVSDSLDEEDVKVFADVSCGQDSAADEMVPANIMGDLESLFAEISPPEPVVPEQEGVVETLGSEVDYNIYYNPVEGARHVMPETPLRLRDLSRGIPLDHVIQFVRDYKCFDTEVIQAREGMYVEHVIITSVHNTKHLKDASRAFFLMCRDDYDMPMGNNEKSNTGHKWKAYDVGHSLVHFFLPVQRAKLNLESFWLGQDAELEDPVLEEERYTSDLLEGLFPDEDFSKLGQPFELVRDNKDIR